MRKLLPLVLLTFVFGACKSTDAAPAQAEMGIVNKTCPLMPDHPIDEEVTVEYMGHTVGFCCEGCVGKFESWPQEKKDEFVTACMEGMGK